MGVVFELLPVDHIAGRIDERLRTRYVKEKFEGLGMESSIDADARHRKRRLAIRMVDSGHFAEGDQRFDELALFPENETDSAVERRVQRGAIDRSKQLGYFRQWRPA